MLERGVRNSNEIFFSSFNFSQFIANHAFISETQALIHFMYSYDVNSSGPNTEALWIITDCVLSVR